MCSGSEAGSYLRLIDFVYHSTLGLRVMKKKDAGFSVDQHQLTRVFRVRRHRWVRVEGAAFRVHGTRFRAKGRGFMVKGSELRVQGVGYRVRSLGRGVWGTCPGVWG